MGQGSSNESITFRINSNYLSELRRLADEDKISLNTLVNQILKSYVDWESVAVKAGFAVFQREVVKELFNAVDQNTLQQIAMRTADKSKDTLLLMKGATNLDAALSLLNNRSKKAGFSYREFDEPDGQRIVVQHDMGINYSTFFKTHNERMFNNAGYSVKIDTTDSSTIIKILNK